MDDTLAFLSLGEGPSRAPVKVGRRITAASPLASGALGSTPAPQVGKPPDERPAAMQLATLAHVADDAIIDAIIAFASEERRTNFAFLGRYSHGYMLNGADLCIYPAGPDDVARICRKWTQDPTKQWALGSVDPVGCRWLTFFQPIYELEDTVQLRLRPASPAHTIINVADLEVLDIEFTKSWVDLRVWMRQKMEWHDLNDMKYPLDQIDEQALWWERNGKVFPLLALPREMRDLIYLYTIGTVIVPQVKTTRGHPLLTLGSGYRHFLTERVGKRLDPDVQRPNTSILRVNRQVYHEAREAAWRDTTKRFRHIAPSELGVDQHSHHPPQAPFILQVQALAPPLALSHVQLECSAACYFQMLGLGTGRGGDPWGYDHWGGPPAPFHISTLQHLHTVRTLDLRFISPKHPDAVCPWSQRRDTTHSCQKIWIDWFFTFALKYLRKCSFKTTMSGCIKDSTRGKWEAIFQDEKEGRLHDMTQRAKAIRSRKTDHNPIPCHCTIPCVRGVDLFADFDKIERRQIVGLQEEIENQYFSFKD